MLALWIPIPPLVNPFAQLSMPMFSVPLFWKMPWAPSLSFKIPKIITVSSVMGSITLMMDPTGPYRHMIAEVYRMTKAALNMLTACQHAKLQEIGGTAVPWICSHWYWGATLKAGRTRVSPRARRQVQKEFWNYRRETRLWYWQFCY